MNVHSEPRTRSVADAIGVKVTVQDRQAVTLQLAERALGYRYGELPTSAQRIAIQCLIDWFAVTLAAVSGSVHRALFDAITQERCSGSASIIGHSGKFPAPQAAIVNGTTAHALDYDDVNLAISGHPSAVILSAVLALGQARKSTGSAMLSAFVAGYETACRVGTLVNPDHMNRGFHATGTIGSFGAAAACSHLLCLNIHQTAHAMGLAGTNAAGLKAMFGTMGKPLHAGLAARNGLESALFTASGYTSRVDILECSQGFAASHSSAFRTEACLDEVPSGFHLHDNLFKFDASCYGTHAAMECVRRIRKARPLHPDEVREVKVVVDRSLASVCNIQRPQTGLQGQFSIRLSTAFALLGVDTASLSSYSDAQINDPRVHDLMERICVTLADDWPAMQAEVTIVFRDGRSEKRKHDSGVPSQDLDLQSARVEEKFGVLAGEVLGAAPSRDLLQMLRGFDSAQDVDAVMSLCGRSGD